MGSSPLLVLASLAAACGSKPDPAKPTPAAQKGVPRRHGPHRGRVHRLLPVRERALARGAPIPASQSRWSRRWEPGELAKERPKGILDEVSAKPGWRARGVEQQARRALRRRAREGPRARREDVRARRPSGSRGAPDRQFFIAWGRWRGDAVCPELARLMAQGDPHPIPKYRVIGPLANTPAFAAAFSCEAGAPMVRANRCEIW